jgi:hypothetical protein
MDGDIVGVMWWIFGEVVAFESCLEGGGVNRANLKFTNLNTTTSRVSVRNINESERGCKNKSQANKK